MLLLFLRSACGFSSLSLAAVVFRWALCMLVDDGDLGATSIVVGSDIESNGDTCVAVPCCCCC